MPRPQFSIRTLLWLTLVVAAFLGGMAWQKHREESFGKKWYRYHVERGLIVR